MLIKMKKEIEKIIKRYKELWEDEGKLNWEGLQEDILTLMKGENKND